MNVSYNLDTGMLEKMKTFTFLYPRANRMTITDSNVEIIREYSGVNKLTDEWYRYDDVDLEQTSFTFLLCESFSCANLFQIVFVGSGV